MGVNGGSRGSTLIVLDVFILLNVFIFVHCDGRKIIPLSNFAVQETPREFLRDEGEREGYILKMDIERRKRGRYSRGERERVIITREGNTTPRDYSRPGCGISLSRYNYSFPFPPTISSPLPSLYIHLQNISRSPILMFRKHPESF